MIEKESPDPFIEQAEEYMQAGRCEEAVSIYRVLVEKYPSDDSYLLALAWAYHDSGKLPEAIACFEQIMSQELKQAVFTGFAYDELVRIFKSQGLYESLIQVCEKAVNAQPEDTGYLGDLAYAYLKMGSFGKAVHVYERMIAVDPAEADFYCRLGNALIHAGNLSEGEEAYRKAAEMESSAADRFFDKLAETFSQTGNQQLAEEAQQKALKLCPDKPLYYLNLTEILVKQQKFAEARAACEEAIRLDPADAAVYCNRLGNNLSRAGFYKEAIDAFRQAMGMDPGNPFYCLSAAECCEALGLHDEAEKYLQRSTI